MDWDFDQQREQMVALQIERRGIKDPKVLGAMRRVRRELFVPKGERRSSYVDGPISIGFGQTISQPYIVAYMTELLKLEGSEKVLEIGTGSGYQTAVLAEIVEDVYTLEIIPQLSRSAQHCLTEELNYSDIHFRIGSGQQGWPEQAPFSRILITAAAREFPIALFGQLADKGVAVSPVGDFFQRIIRYRKEAGRIDQEELIGVSFVPLV